MGGSTGGTLGTVGPYRVEREIARGGMGIVYLAHDSRLNRTVALKALPPEVSSDPERLERFERESKLLASLNHPNIGAIYDVVEDDDRRYLALEHIEGETLAHRISRGALPVDEALEICQQIASGMEAAHERGVIHRDLKPGNIMITPEDQVKIVDFGLARGSVTSESAVLDSPATVQSPLVAPASPTITSPAFSPGTIPGVILGTAPYLSPEQARGKPVDRRTDIWSFGCIIYECLTGKMAFQGETVSDTVASILKQEPIWGALPRETPGQVRELIQRCLEKDPRRRLRDIGDARVVLEGVRSAPAGRATDRAPFVRFRSKRETLVAWAGVIALLVVGVLAGSRLAPGRGGSSRGHGLVNLSLPVPQGLKYQFSRITPDGRTILMFALPREGDDPTNTRPHIYARSLSGRAFEGIPGTEHASGFALSPDGASICFSAPASERSSRLRIYRTRIDGKTPVTFVADLPPDRATPAWADAKTLIAVDLLGKDYVVIPLDGSPPSKPLPLEIPGVNAQIFTANGSNIPGRGVFLNTITYERNAYRYGIGVLDLKTRKAKMVLPDAASPRYVRGYLLFTRDSTLFAAPFDLNKLTVRGEPFPIVSGLQTTANRLSGFHVSGDGTLTYALGAGAERRRIATIDRAGAIQDYLPDRRNYRTIAIERGGSRIAFHITNEDLLDEIWVLDRATRSLRRLVTDPSADCGNPVWSPDGSQLAFSKISRSKQDGIYVVASNGVGVPKRVCAAPDPEHSLLVPADWFPDGRILSLTGTSAKSELALVSAKGDTPPRPFVIEGSRRVFDARLSPDGRRLAYTSDESGKAELYVRDINPDGSPGPSTQLSEGGAAGPCWTADGKQLYYVAPGPKIVCVPAQIASTQVSSSATIKCDDLIDSFRPMGVLHDGGVMAILAEGGGDVRQIEVTMSLFDELNARGKKTH